MNQSQQETSGFEEYCISLSSREGSNTVYPFRVTTTLGETEEGEFQNPLKPDDVEYLLASIPRATRQSPTRNVGQGDALDPTREIGAQLFTSLFSGRLRALYDRVLRRVEDNRGGLRIRLVMEAPELVRLPWEFLYDTKRQDYLALSRRTLLVRHVTTPFMPRGWVNPVQPPLRVLVAIGDSQDKYPAKKWVQSLRQMANLSPELLQLSVIDASFEKLLDTVREREYHVLQLISIQGTSPSARIISRILGPQSTEWPVKESGLGQHLMEWLVLSPVVTLARQEQFRLVIVHSAQSGPLAYTLSKKAPAVLGIGTQITDEVVAVFFSCFYRALIDHQPLEIAVAQARQAIDAQFPGGREWGLPVLYLQAADGVMLPPPSARDVMQALEISEDEPERKKLQLQLTVYRRNLLALKDRQAKYPEFTHELMTQQINDLEGHIANLESQLSRLP